MQRKFERSSVRDSLVRRRWSGRRRAPWLSIVVIGCSPLDVEVGSVPPVASDAGDAASSLATDASDAAPPMASDAGDSAPRPAADAGDTGQALADRSGGSGEAGRDASEAGSVGRCDASAPIRLYYWNLSGQASSNHLNYIVKVENASGAPLALSSLEVRYYLTNELSPPTAIDIFYTDTCCSNRVSDFNGDVLRTLEAMPARPNANAYLRIAFSTAVGSLAPGDAVQVELGFHDPGYARNLTQTNDYSYRATSTGTQAQWNECPGAQCDAKFTTCAITVHRDDVLVWGTPP
jgi:Cellulose binding domain